MAALGEHRNQWELPRFKESFELGVRNCTDVYDVKFYPFNKPGIDPIFAVASIQHILICRPLHDKDKMVEILCTIEDKNPDANNSSLAWVRDSPEGRPLLCVAGGSAQIKVLDALSGTLVRTLDGHGGDINDLIVSPLNPNILASASEDTTIRIWSLEKAHESQPCAVLFAGEGHLETVLSIAFHESGKYILSGGQDHIVNLWTVPELPDATLPITGPQVIHYPHFSTSEVHSQIVDCVAFYNDLILSKAFQEDTIVLWSITGFSSEIPVPSRSTAPSTHDNKRATRSAFCPPSVYEKSPTSPGPYKRLLQFDSPGCVSFYMRFKLFVPPPLSSLHPILAMANSSSKVSFWDLTRLVDYQTYISSVGPNTERPEWLHSVPIRKKEKEKGPISRMMRENSPAESNNSSSHSVGVDTVDSASAKDLAASKEVWERKYGIHGTGMGVQEQVTIAKKRVKLNGIEPHRIETVPKLKGWTGRQVAWSTGGEWCVVVGSPRVVAIFQRWG